MKKIIIPLSLILTIILSALNPLIYRIQNCGVCVIENGSIYSRYETLLLNGYSDISWEIYSNGKIYSAYPNGVHAAFFNGLHSDDTTWHYSKYIDIGDFRLHIPNNIKYEPVREKTIQFDNTEYTFSYNGYGVLQKRKLSSEPGTVPRTAYIESWKSEEGAELFTWDNKIISITAPIDPGWGKLENRDEATEQLAKDYFNKYAGALIYTATDEHSEYRLSPANEDTPFNRLISEYNDTLADKSDTISYYFRKYIYEVSTYETVKITFDFQNRDATVTIENADSAPLLSSDVINLYSDEITDDIERFVERFYSNEKEAIYGKIVNIDSSERYLSKGFLGSSGVVSNVIVEFENSEEKALIQTYTLLEYPRLFAYYTFVPYIIVQSVLSAVLIFLIVFIIVKRIRKKKIAGNGKNTDIQRQS